MKVTHMRAMPETATSRAFIVVVREDGTLFQAHARGAVEWWPWVALPPVPGTEADFLARQIAAHEKENHK